MAHHAAKKIKFLHIHSVPPFQKIIITITGYGRRLNAVVTNMLMNIFIINDEELA